MQNSQFSSTQTKQSQVLRYKSIGFIALLFALLLSAVTVSLIQAETITVSCDAAELITAINTANNNGEADIINLNNDCIYSLTTPDNNTDGPNGLPVINSAMTIEGNGATIQRDGATNFRLLLITSTGNITLNNLTLKNGAAISMPNATTTDHGGGIYIHQGQLTLNQSLITSNTAKFYGGGIYNLKGVVSLSQTTVSHNVVSNTVTAIASSEGGGIYNEKGSVYVLESDISNNQAGDGGGLKNTGQVTLANSNVTNNVSMGKAGGLYNGMVMTITNGTISHNQAQFSAGGIWNNADLIIEQSRIYSNVANIDQNSGGGGGGLYNNGSDLHINNSEITENSANCGGALMGALESNRIYLTQTQVLHNRAEQGGAFCGNGSYELLETSVSSNTATAQGGGIFLTSGRLDVISSTLSNNITLNHHGGAIYISNGQLGITNTTIDQNKAGYSGAGIYVDRGSLSLTGTHILSNSANDTGGGIYNRSEFTIINSTLAGNIANANQSSSGDGGAIYNDGSGKIRGSRIYNNRAYNGGFALNGFGGGIYNKYTKPLYIDSSTIISNFATSSGGGISNFGEVHIDNSTITNNYSQGVGGGLYSSGNYDGTGITTIYNTTWSDNQAMSSGGAIYNDTLLTMTHSTVISNQTLDAESDRSDGGGIFNASPASHSNYIAYIKNSIITNNIDNGGQAPDVDGSFTSLGDNIIGDLGESSGFGEQDLIGVDPRLGPLQDNGGNTLTYALLPDSPAVDATTCDTELITDQRGEPRPNPVSTRCDIGAFESALLPQADLSLSQTTDTTSPALGGNIKFTLTITNHGPRTAEAIVVHDMLSNGYDFVSADAGQGEYDKNTGMWAVGTVISGEQTSLILEAEIMGTGIYTNYAQISSAHSVDPNSTPGNNSVDEDDDTTMAVSPRLPQLTISKSGPDRVRQEQYVIYTLNITNTGDAPAQNIFITDTLPISASYVSGGNVMIDDVLNWSVVPILETGKTAIATFLVQAPGGIDIVNFDYGVRADYGIQAQGTVSVTTKILVGSQGTFVESGQDLGRSRSRAADMKDIDGDGDLDILTANEGANEVWFNDGQGTLSNSGQQLGNDSSQAVALADFDNDGDADAVVVNEGANEVWFNDGQGTFTSGTQTLGESDSQAVSVGDLNNDGTLDLVVGNNGASEVWFNDGQGTFSIGEQSLDTGNSQTVSLGDINGDGAIDAVFGNDGVNTVWFNDGQGVFNDSGQTIDNGDTQAVVLGDLNGDNLLDMVVGNNGANTVWFNDGNGKFVDSNQNFENSNSQTVALGDFDEDDDLDVIVGGEGPNTVWFNDGTGTLNDSGQSLGQDNTQAVVLGDLDGDSDLDTFVANSSAEDGSNQVLFNQNELVREVEAPGGTLDLSQGLTFTIDIPADSLAKTTTFTYTPLILPSAPAPDGTSIVGQAFELKAAQGDKAVANPFQTPVTMRRYYNPTGHKPEQIRLYYRDVSTSQWLDVATTCSPESQYNYGPDYIEVDICHLTEFAMFESASEAVYLPVVIK
ncbi:FG-GAP-like repeat-containing protein [Anaerolineales bacterium HSG24]|nr:FG-GAP-like repeat-containing protein [Anaerolineales bacterium HSG24]